MNTDGFIQGNIETQGNDQFSKKKLIKDTENFLERFSDERFIDNEKRRCKK